MFCTRSNRKKNQISDFYFLSYAEKQCGRIFWNAVERELVETRVLNPTASEASNKPEQRSYRKTNLKKKVLAPDSPGAEMSSAETYPTPNLSVIYVYTIYI